MKVIKEQQLLEFLFNNVNMSHKKIKSLLKYQNILVNNKIITKYDYLLYPKDVVEIKEFKTKKHPSIMDIIYEDKDIIVLNKPSGLLTIATPKEKEKTLYHITREYVKNLNKSNNLYIIHRLDRDTSGIVMFAKSEKVKNLYQKNWNEIVKKRKYIAIVEGILDKKQGTLKSFLEENDDGYVYVSKNGKLAITDYIVTKETSKYSVLDIDIKTGRKNQIRVQLNEIKHPIVGDKKYGNKGKKMYLCAYELEIINPITNKINKYKIHTPKSFTKFIEENK